MQSVSLLPDPSYLRPMAGCSVAGDKWRRTLHLNTAVVGRRKRAYPLFPSFCISLCKASPWSINSPALPRTVSRILPSVSCWVHQIHVRVRHFTEPEGMGEVCFKSYEGSQQRPPKELLRPLLQQAGRASETAPSMGDVANWLSDGETSVGNRGG